MNRSDLIADIEELLLECEDEILTIRETRGKILDLIDEHIAEQKAEIRKKGNARIAGFVARLDSMPDGDQEEAHMKADGILLHAVHEDVANAYRRAKDRIGFWYA